ncbi:MAG: hypothetical protein ACYC3V_19630, partial [Chloroflexota bacterium]
MAVSTDERTTEGEATDVPLLVASLVFLLFTWLVVFGWLALLTEILLVPWDLIPGDFRPPVGSWSRTVNDFFEGSRGDRLLGQIVVGASAAAFVFRMVRARRRHMVVLGFFGANLLYLIGGFSLIMMALAVSGQLFSGYGTPVGVGLHGRALPLAVLATVTALLLLGQWTLEVRSAPDHGIALGWIWDRRPGKTFGWSSYLVLGFSSVLATAVLTLVMLGLSVRGRQRLGDGAVAANWRSLMSRTAAATTFLIAFVLAATSGCSSAGGTARPPTVQAEATAPAATSPLLTTPLPTATPSGAVSDMIVPPPGGIGPQETLERFMEARIDRQWLVVPGFLSDGLAKALDSDRQLTAKTRL